MAAPGSLFDIAGGIASCTRHRNTQEHQRGGANFANFLRTGECADQAMAIAKQAPQTTR
jgi:hypothetical protein